jgi:hypothetical protein
VAYNGTRVAIRIGRTSLIEASVRRKVRSEVAVERSKALEEEHRVIATLRVNEGSTSGAVTARERGASLGAAKQPSLGAALFPKQPCSPPLRQRRAT